VLRGAGEGRGAEKELMGNERVRRVEGIRAREDDTGAQEKTQREAMLELLGESKRRTGRMHQGE
jgi:hypothetical protein